MDLFKVSAPLQNEINWLYFSDEYGLTLLAESDIA